MATYKKYQKKEKIERVPFVPSYPPAEEQEAIFAKLDFSDDNLHVDAGPGSGKSTTIKWVMTRPKMRRMKACMLTMGRAICDDIEPHCAPNVEVNTCHAFGRRSLVSEFGVQPFLSQNKVGSIFKDLFPKLNPENLQGKERGAAFSFMFDFIKLVDLLRINLRDETKLEDIELTAEQYNLNLDCDIAAGLMDKTFAAILAKPTVIDFTDMMWLPIRLGLKVPTFDMMYVDERQDLNSLMIAYILKMSSGRIMTVGDKRQSIYGFGGADPKSTERLIAAFPGIELPLLRCYRCDTDIVDFAKRIYPDIIPFEKNGKGEVREREELDWDMLDGSMVLSRRNALLVKPCFEFLKRGRKANIKGKDIGSNLIKLIESMKSSDTHSLRDDLSEYLDKRVEKLLKKQNVKQAVIDQISDEVNCINEIASTCRTIPDLIIKIESLFSDDGSKGITFSSIHRSKGLESDQVTILNFRNVRLSSDKMSEDEHVQEANLDYVARTRAKHTLDIIV